MKALAAERPRPAILGVKKDSNCSIMKTASIVFRGERFTLSEEMRECFLKLSDMVPEVPRNEEGNIDGTVLMQNVIDYILDLELQLDGHGNFSPAVAFSNSLQSRLCDSKETREPLSEKSLENIVCSRNDLSSCDVLNFNKCTEIKTIDLGVTFTCLPCMGQGHFLPFIFLTADMPMVGGWTVGERDFQDLNIRVDTRLRAFASFCAPVPAITDPS